jgi:hypothetical protein
VRAAGQQRGQKRGQQASHQHRPGRGDREALRWAFRSHVEIVTPAPHGTLQNTDVAGK